MPFNLNYVATTMSGGLSSSDAQLSTSLATVGDGGSISVADMVKLQYEMSRYTITASTASSVVKEMSDCLKSVCQKIS